MSVEIAIWDRQVKKLVDVKWSQEDYLKMSKSKILKYLNLNMISHTWKGVGFLGVAPGSRYLTMGRVLKGSFAFTDGRLL